MAAEQQTTGNKKKTALLVGVTLVTLVLGAIAVITAMRLRQLSQEPVAPTAPQSRPFAQDFVGVDGVCSTEFTIAASQCRGWCNSNSDCGAGFYCYTGGESCTSDAECPTGYACAGGVCTSAGADTGGYCLADTTACEPGEQSDTCVCPAAGVSCQSKVAYLDSTDYTAGDFDVSGLTKLDDGDEVQRGDVIVYQVTLNSSDPDGTAAITDILPAEVTLLEVGDYCNKVDAQTVECEFGGDLPATLAWRVEVNTSATLGKEFTNEIYLNDTLAQCSATLAIASATPTPTPTGTPGPTATPTPTGTPGPTPTNTPGPTPTPTTPAQPTATPVPKAACSQSCSTTSDCSSGLTCTGGMCRNSSCTAEADCVCDGVVGPTATPAPPAPELPTAGIAWPTLVLIIGGGLILLIGVTGLLVL